MTRKVENAFDVVHTFERAVCDYTGAPYAVAVDTCTAALFLCFKYVYDEILTTQLAKGGLHAILPPVPVLQFPSRTFVSAPMMAIHAGFSVCFEPESDVWRNQGFYRVIPLPVWDAAIGLRRGLFPHLHELTPHQRFGATPSMEQATVVCLSFQHRKQLPIGRGGMVLTDNAKLASWCRRARFFGRHEVPIEEETGPELIGWHMYMEPERAARGLALLMHLEDNPPIPDIRYPDLSKYSVFDTHIRSKRYE